MEKESLNDYNPKDGLKEVYHGALPCQSSIYASCTIPKQNGVRPARILLSPLLKNFNVYSCANAPKGQLIWKYPFFVFKLQCVITHCTSNRSKNQRNFC